MRSSSDDSPRTGTGLTLSMSAEAIPSSTVPLADAPLQVSISMDGHVGAGAKPKHHKTLRVRTRSVPT